MKGNLLGFDAEEKKTIEDRKGNFAIVAGVRRQAAYTMMKLLRCVVVAWHQEFGHDEIKSVGLALCDILVKKIIEEGRSLDGKVAFEAKHTQTITMIPT